MLLPRSKQFTAEQIAALQEVDSADEEGWAQFAIARALEFLQFLTDIAELKEDDVFADFGGGCGQVLFAARERYRCRFLLLEASARRLGVAYVNNLDGILCDLANIPLPDRHVQWGFCSQTLEHIDDIHGVLAELHRVVALGCLFLVPLETPEEAAKTDSHAWHSADPQDWRDVIAAAGFRVKMWQDVGYRDLALLAIRDDYADTFNTALQVLDDDCPEAAQERVAWAAEQASGTWLDVGGGSGIAAQALRAAGAASVTIVDISPAKTPTDFQYLVGDICNLPVADASFDWILASHVLEHAPSLEQALTELYRVCRKGSVIIVPLQTWQQTSLRSTHWHAMALPELWLTAVTAAGFAIAEYAVAGQASKPGFNQQLFIKAVKA